MRIMKNAQSWADEQRCQELLDALDVRGGALEEAEFLERVGTFAGGTVRLARLDDQLWAPVQSAMAGHMSGIATPYPGGWIILLPENSAAHENTVIGHEAGHILFGDVPHWNRCSAELRRAIERWRDEPPGDPSQMLPHSALRARTDSRREARAERFGALLTARLELNDTDPAPRDHVDRFFQVGEL